MHCVIPAIWALGDNSPASLLSSWLECRAAFKRSDSGEEPLFCTVAGAANRIGNPVSPDSFRKTLGTFFTGNTSTHSLRKGGARFYAAVETPEQATRDQGGWRTTEVMKEIYTSLTPSEVKGALRTAANEAGFEYALKRCATHIASANKDNLPTEAATAKHYLKMVDNMIDTVPWKVLTRNNTGVYTKALVSHPDEYIRLTATSVLGKLRSSWARFKASSRTE